MVHVVGHSDQDAQSATTESGKGGLQLDVLLKHRLVHRLLDEANHGLVVIVVRFAATTDLLLVFTLEEAGNEFLAEFPFLGGFVL